MTTQDLLQRRTIGRQETPQGVAIASYPADTVTSYQPFAITSDRFRKHVDDPFAANLQVVKVRVLVVILANTVKDGRVDICRHLYGSRLTSCDLTLSDSHKLSVLEHFLVLFKRHQGSALEQTPGPFNTCGAHTDNTTVGPLSDTLNPMTVDSRQYNNHSSINTTSSFDKKHLACYKVYLQEKMTHSIYICCFYYPVTRLGPRKVCKPKLKLTMPNCPTRVKLGCLGGRKAPPTEKCVFFDAHLPRLKPR